MTTMAVHLQPMTHSEYLTLPEDSCAELLDGHLHVNARPTLAHQRALGELFARLRATLPQHLEAVLEYGWHIDDRWEPAPDLMVLRRAQHGARFRGIPNLAVEILSSQPAMDTGGKRVRYESARLPHYWLVDLAVPSITVLQLVDGVFTQVDLAVGGVQTSLPFDGGSLTVAPADLL